MLINQTGKSITPLTFANFVIHCPPTVSAINPAGAHQGQQWLTVGGRQQPRKGEGDRGNPGVSPLFYKALVEHTSEWYNTDVTLT